jgi:hypothetical protein
MGVRDVNVFELMQGVLFKVKMLFGIGFRDVIGGKEMASHLELIQITPLKEK